MLMICSGLIQGPVLITDLPGQDTSYIYPLDYIVPEC